MTENKENLLGLLIESGIDSRRRLASAIIEGRVKVNGAVATNLRQPVNRGDHITVNGQTVRLETEKSITLMMNKPSGVLSTVSDDRGRKTVLDILPEKYRHLRLYPAGRLDRDTTGLLLLTNDGELTNRITHPKYALEKEYYAKIEGTLSPADIRKLEKGVELTDGLTAPAKVRELKNNPYYNYSIIIHEGRKRQVRRMFAALSHGTLALKRVRIGRLTLGDLKEGDVREITGASL